MKYIKKIVQTSMAILLLFTFVITSNATYLADVSVGDWTRDYINYVTDNNLLEKSATNMFYPDDNLTRADTAMMLYRHAGLPDTSLSYLNAFSDVSPQADYAYAVAWVSYYGIMTGSGDGKFNPNSPITRQDLIVTFHRYSYCTNGSTNNHSASGDITVFNDVNEISDYAIESIQWAVGTNFISGSSGYLMPKTLVTREVGAVFMVKYGLFIEGIVKNRDNYSFRVSSLAYKNNDNSRYITSDHFDLLKYYVNTYSLSTEKATTTINLLENKRMTASEPVYGMLITAFLDKIGKVDINGNFGTQSQTNMSMLSGSHRNLASAINFYDLTQYFFQAPNRDVTFLYTRKLVNTIRDNGIGIFSYSHITGSTTYTYLVIGHSLRVASDGSYTLKLYSPQLHNIYYDSLLHISEDYSTIQVEYKYDSQDSIYKNITSYSIYDDVTSLDDMTYNKYDIDGAFNSMNNTSTSSLQSENITTLNKSSDDDYTELHVTLNDDFIITNASGDTIEYSDGQIDGTMDIISQSMVAHGESAAAEAIFTVENSDYYVFMASNENTNQFYIKNNEMYAGAEGLNMSKIIISSDGYVNVEGHDVEYKVVTSPMIENMQMIVAVGTAEDNISISNVAGNIVLRGDKNSILSIFDGTCSHTPTISTVTDNLVYRD